MKRIWFLVSYVLTALVVDLAISRAAHIIEPNVWWLNLIPVAVLGSVAYWVYRPLRNLMIGKPEPVGKNAPAPSVKTGVPRVDADEVRMQRLIDLAAKRHIPMGPVSARAGLNAKTDKLPTYSSFLLTDEDDVVSALTEAIAGVWEVDPSGVHREQALTVMPVLRAYIADVQAGAYRDSEYLAALVETRKSLLATHIDFIKRGHDYLAEDAWLGLKRANAEIERIASGRAA